MIRIYKKTKKEDRLITSKQLNTGSWVYVQNPSTYELKKLKKELKLDIGLLKDAIDPYEVPRMEIEDNNVYVFSRFPYEEGSKITTHPLGIIINDDFLITVSDYELPFLTKFTKDTISFYTTQKTKLFIQIISEINVLYNRFLTEIARQIRRIISDPGKIKNKDILQFVIYEEVLNTFISDLQPTSVYLTKLLSGKYLKLYDEDKDLIEDILLSTEQLIERAKSNTKSIVNIREAYSTVISNNLNQVMKVLTVITVILTIPTITASLYGMNVNLPYANQPWIFGGILVFILVVSIMLVFIFKRSDWL